jgi:hypothetical protein
MTDRTPVLPVKVWNNYFFDLLERIEATLGTKANEYAIDGDRMWNFNEGVRQHYDKNISREQVQYGMALKHWISINDIIRDSNTKIPAEAYIREKFGDMIVYLILQQGSLLHRGGYFNPKLDDLSF